MEFAGDFSWGYNPSHPFAIASIYGGPDAFKRFVKAAHEHGMAVISMSCTTTLVSPISIYGGLTVGAKTIRGESTFTTIADRTPPGENAARLRPGEVRHYLCDNALMWFEEYHVDGLRWDAITYIKNILGSDSSPAMKSSRAGV